MNLTISGHHLDLTPAIRSYITSKLTRIKRHFDHVIEVNVLLSIEKLQQKAEVHVHLPGKSIHVEAIDSDLYAAVDALIDKLDRQVIKHKESRHSHSAEALKRTIASQE